jgi:hypothetical protein
MPSGLKSAVSLGLSALALIGFAVIYIYAMVEGLSGDPSSTLTRPNFVFLANALAGLVGSVVAAGFGQTLPPPRHNRTLRGALMHLLPRLKALGTLWTQGTYYLGGGQSTSPADTQ